VRADGQLDVLDRVLGFGRVLNLLGRIETSCEHATLSVDQGIEFRLPRIPMRKAAEYFSLVVLTLMSMPVSGQNAGPGAQTQPGSGASGSVKSAVPARQARWRELLRERRAQRMQQLQGSPARLDAAALSPSVNVERDIAYGPGSLEKLDVCYPKEHTQLNPVIVFFHGGGWRAGDKRQHQAKENSFAEHQVVFVDANYGLAPSVVHPRQIQDVAAAVAWTKANIKKYGGNPTQIFIMGHSAGAHLVDLLGSNEKYLREKGLSLSDLKGVISLDTASLDLLQRTAEDTGEGKLVGGMIKQAFGSDPAVLKEASPTLNIAPGKTYPPFLMFCGARRKDAIDAHKSFVKAMDRANGSVLFLQIPMSHRNISLGAGDTHSTVFKGVLDFIHGHCDTVNGIKTGA